MDIKVSTTQQREVLDITEAVQQRLQKTAGSVHIFVAHTTCAVTTADLDPGTDQDLLEAVWEMIPKLNYRHAHNPAHVPAHLASSIIGPSITVPVKDDQLLLGSWQRVVLVELDGPRQRQLIITPLNH